MAFCVHLKENSCPVERSLRFAPEEIREGILGHETFFPMPSLRTRMRTRVVWLELSLILLALTFAELGEVLRELRTDVVFDWFVSLAPLIWINVSILVLYAFFRLYFSPSVVHPTTERARAGAIALSVLSGLVFALAFQVVTRSHRAVKALPSPLLGFAVVCPACAGGPLSGLFLAYVAPIAFMGGFGSASAFSRLLVFATLLLVVTLVVLWIVIAFISNVMLSDVPPRL